MIMREILSFFNQIFPESISFHDLCENVKFMLIWMEWQDFNVFCVKNE